APWPERGAKSSAFARRSRSLPPTRTRAARRRPPLPSTPNRRPTTRRPPSPDPPEDTATRPRERAGRTSFRGRGALMRIPRGTTILLRLTDALLTAVLLSAVALAVLVIAAQLTAYQPIILRVASMSTSIPRGAIAIIADDRLNALQPSAE